MFAGIVSMLLFFVSVLTLAVIAADRYFAVVRKSHHRFTKNLVRHVGVVIWTRAVVFAIPRDLILINKPEKKFIARVLINCGKHLFLREHDNRLLQYFRIVPWTLSFMLPCLVIFPRFWTNPSKCPQETSLCPYTGVSEESRRCLFKVCVHSSHDNNSVLPLSHTKPCIFYFESKHFGVELFSGVSYHYRSCYEFQVCVLSGDFCLSQSEIFLLCSDILTKEMQICSAYVCSHLLSIAQLQTRYKVHRFPTHKGRNSIQFSINGQVS